MRSSIHPAPLMLGPYELLQRIATGGMAEVYLARRAGPRGFQKVVAVKRILPQLSQDNEFVAMFVDEARVCARLVHPNIVQVFDFGEHDGELYMAMEYVDGTTAARLVRAAAARKEEVPLECALYIVLGILRGLEYAHNARDGAHRPLSLVHRDVSPGNVLIDRSGAVKLTDFGIARAAEIERRTDAGQLKGKLGYMSPEQVVGRELDARSDLFTVGIVLAELVMLRPLFSGPNEIEVLTRIRDADLSVIDRAGHRVPEDVRTVLFRALARDRALRYPSASVFANAIEEILRRRRLQVGPAKLAAWMEKTGLVAHLEPEPAPGEGDSSRQTANLRREATGSARARLSSRAPASDPAQEGAPTIYAAKTRDDRTIDRLSYARLVEMLVTGELDLHSLVSREDSMFREAARYPELSRFTSSAAFRWDEESWASRDDVARIDPATLPARCFSLVRKRETGALLFADGPRRKKIYFLDGVPEFVVGTDKRELLGEYLVASGQVLRMEIEMALSMLPRFDGRLGEALCGLGILRPIELVRAVQRQLQDRFVDAFRWRAGEVWFARGARSQEETFPLGIDPFELVSRAIQTAYSYAELEAMFARIGGAELAPTLPRAVRIEAFRLGPLEERILESFTAPRTIGQLVTGASSYATMEEVLRTVFFGLSCDLVTCDEWPGSPAPESGLPETVRA